MAELLIKAEEPWQITDSGSRKGDIIVVRPDGWKWGREECLPRFVVVKVAEKDTDVKYYEYPLTDANNLLVKYRKHAVTAVAVDSIKEEVKDFEEITPVTLKATINVKTVQAVG